MSAEGSSPKTFSPFYQVTHDGDDHETDAVRRHSPFEINRAIDDRIENNVRHCVALGEPAISKRIDELDREWDVDRVMESNVSLLSFLGVALGLGVSRRWLLLPVLALPILFQHSVQGWSPVLSLLRRLGVRTRGEIDKEKYALKAWRGDYAGLIASEEEEVSKG